MTRFLGGAGFLHGGEMKQFGYEYLQGSNLLHKLIKPNGMTLTQSYETQRDLPTGMAYHRGSTLVAQREYTYDVLSRPTARTTSRQGNVVNDTFVHNTRSELASAQVNGETYGYDYDNVGNRRMSMEAGDYAFYEANALNQYTDITGSEDEADFSFTLIFDADGNQTLIKTETGIWTAIYNAENRPVRFTNEATGTVVTCAYDSMGRRSFKKVTVYDTVTLHQRYLYRGYLQIACIDLTRSHHPGLWLITWDPTQPVATLPMAIQKDGTWYTYGLDLTKNVCEIFGSSGYISTTYTYSPYGAVTTSGTVTQPIQWSSEIADANIGLIYFNYRYYNSYDGRWINRDTMYELGFLNLYRHSNDLYSVDTLGLFCDDKKNSHNTYSGIESFTLTFKHVGLQDMDITIQDPSSTIRKKLNGYIKEKVKKGLENQFPELKELRQLTKSAMQLYSTMKSKLSFWVTWFSSVGTLYDKVEITLTSSLCCCSTLKKVKQKGNKKQKATPKDKYPKTKYCCKAKQVKGYSSKKLFLDLRGAIIGGVVYPDKIGKHVINTTVNTVFNTLKSAVIKLKANKCGNNTR